MSSVFSSNNVYTYSIPMMWDFVLVVAPNGDHNPF
jgi:hypothetical protein